MEDKVLVVIDMQNDFIRGVFGNSSARRIIPNVCKKIRDFKGKNIFFTTDIHGKDYKRSIEGKMLPPHCYLSSKGSRIDEVIMNSIIEKEKECGVGYCVNYIKTTFGSTELAKDMITYVEDNEIDTIEVVGLCTDICVISNVLMLRAFCPNTRIIVYADCCAGSTQVNHKCAIEVMKQNCIEVVNEYD